MLKMLMTVTMLAMVGCADTYGDEAPAFEQPPTGGEPSALTPSGGPEAAQASAMGGYVAASDEAESKRIVEEMWSVMTAPSCWTLGTITYKFFGEYQYRYVNSDTRVGSIALVSAGRYGQQPSAIVQMDGETFALSVIDRTNLAVVRQNPSGQWFTSVYVVSASCL